jgi:hypothetical protein
MQVPIVELLAVSRLMNQCVGDAIGGLLFVDAVLRSGGLLLLLQAHQLGGGQQLAPPSSRVIGGHDVWGDGAHMPRGLS